MSYSIGYSFLTYHKKKISEVHPLNHLGCHMQETIFRIVYPKEERRESEFTYLFHLSSGSKFALQGSNQTKSLRITSRLDKFLAASQEVRSNTMYPVTLRCLDRESRNSITDAGGPRETYLMGYLGITRPLQRLRGSKWPRMWKEEQTKGI